MDFFTFLSRIREYLFSQNFDVTDLSIGVLGFLLMIGVSLNRFSKFLKMPILICFLGVGVLCGPHGFEMIPELDVKTVQKFGEVALCFIIFTGGLQTSFSSIKKVFLTGTILSTVGVVLTAVLIGIFTSLISNMKMFHYCSVTAGILVGSIFSSTDAAAVFAILRGQKAAINPKLQSLLEYESGSNDPAAFLLTTVMIGIVSSSTEFSFFGVSWDITKGIFWGLGMATAVGFLCGVFGQWFFNWIQNFLEYSGLRLVVAVAIVLLCYGLSAGVFKTNGLMACYVAGITMGNIRFNFKQTFTKFHDGFSWLMQILLFTLLGSYFDFHKFSDRNVMLAAVLISLVLMFVVRPLVVFLCMLGSQFTIRERIFTSWVGIRGSAPIMLAAMVLASVPQVMVAGAQFVFYTVFVIVILSILIQGSSLMWVAKKLGLVLPYQEKEAPLITYDERSDGREMCNFTIAEKNILVNKNMADASAIFKNEFEILILMVKRGRKYLQPLPDLVLKAGDTLTFLGEREGITNLHNTFFPNEEYSSQLTFRQIMKDFSKKVKESKKARKSRTQNKA